jgi:hypothetical protein
MVQFQSTKDRHPEPRKASACLRDPIRARLWREWADQRASRGEGPCASPKELKLPTSRHVLKSCCARGFVFQMAIWGDFGNGPRWVARITCVTSCSGPIQSIFRLPSYNDESEVYAAHEYCSLDFDRRNQTLDVRAKAVGTTVPIGARAGCCNAAGVSPCSGQHPSGCLECQRTDPCAPGRKSFGFHGWISGRGTFASIRSVGEEHLR